MSWRNLAFLTLTICLFSCGGSAPPDPPPQASLMSIVFSPSSLSVQLPATQQFKATGNYSDGSSKDITQTVNWSSSDPSVATISNAPGSQGLATTVGPGTANITAVSGSIQNSVTVTVSPAALKSLAISPSSLSVQFPATQQFKATGTYADGSTKDITQSVNWSSSNALAATISNASGSQGLATMVGPGTANITAVSGSIQNSVTVTVSPAALESLAISPSSLSVQFPATQQFKATGTYADGSTKDITQSVNWSSSNALAATISNASGSQGLATMVGPGTANITAVSGSIQNSVAITVISSVTVSVSPGFTSLTPTQTQTFVASVQGTTNTAVTWSVDGVKDGSSTTGTISSSGVYTPPTTGGFHTITATSQEDIGQSASGQVAVTDNPGVFTQHYDNARTGQNLDEIVLTPQNVNLQHFGKLFSYAVDGGIYAEPLYVANVAVPGKGYHNIVYVATIHDTVYAFDADHRSPGLLWQTSLINTSAGETTVPCAEETEACDFYGAEIGVTGTPVIDPATGTLYVSAFSEISGTYFHKLHALDIATGAEKFGGPVIIQGSVAGAGENGNGITVAFDPHQHLQRPGLLLANGMVYVGFASYGDARPFHGWLFAYDAKTLQQVVVYNDTSDGYEGGIWQGATAPASDANGNIYLMTGNGDFTADQGGRDYGDSVIKLSPQLSVMDYFTPFNEDFLNQTDTDLGSGGAVLLPDQSGLHTHLLVGGGKEGKIYLLDRDNLGHYQAGSDSQIVESIPHAVGLLWGAPAYWNEYLYFQGEADVLKMYAMNNGLIQLGQVYQGQTVSQFGGLSPAISAKGTQGAVVWTLDLVSVDGAPKAGAVLRAYDATNVTVELYDSNQAGTRDVGGLGMKFQVPTVVNGKVYAGTDGELDVYGLLPQ